MPTYGKNDFKESNVNYLNKDFQSLKSSLMSYAKSYFPNTYRDFNETSPGMMLLEMNAYVGDVLSFYIDQQYREMLLPLSEERRNIINLAKMFGYKVKPIVPSYVDLTFYQDLDAMDDDTTKVDYTTGGIYDKGIQVRSDDKTITFETLDVLDFQISSSLDTLTPASTNTQTDLVETYQLERTVRAISGKEKITTFTIGAPEKFKKITLTDKNIIDIISVKDSNGNDWYEVDFLAQDKVPVPKHYTQDGIRTSPYMDSFGLQSSTAVPYSLQYIKTSKRFTRETNLDNTTSLIFGNGVLRDGNLVDGDFIDLEQVGIVVPGQSNDLNEAINPLLGDEYSTLGETPNNTTLTVTYRVGGGISSNVPSNSLNSIISSNSLEGSAGVIGNITVSNRKPARGGKDEESIEEIRHKAQAFFSTQNRCVTKEDYEARVLNLPSKFGNIAKVYVARVSGQDDYINQDLSMMRNYLQNMNMWATQLKNVLDATSDIVMGAPTADTWTDLSNMFHPSDMETPNVMLDNIQNNMGNINTFLDTYTYMDETGIFGQASINIYTLAYDNAQNLVGNPMVSYNNTISDNVPTTLMVNIKNYLENFKILTDTIQILDGYIINFGVFFDVVAEKYADKQTIKFRCIDKIKEYFHIDKMQFNQPIHIGKLEYELMGIEGIRSVNHITISQESDYNSEGVDSILAEKTWTYSFSTDVDIDPDTEGNQGGFTNNGSAGYNYKYDFQNALVGGVIRPPVLSTPAVFELKNPGQNIKGRVR
mgnify:CR=1 FL=1